MLADIAEFSVSLLIEVRSPPSYGILSVRKFRHGVRGLPGSGSHLLHLDFPEVYRFVRENRHSVLRPMDEIVSAGMVADVDPSSLPDLLVQSNLHSTTTVQ